MPHSVVGFYAEFPPLVAATRAAKAQNCGEIRTISPIPLPEIDEILGTKRSPVRRFALAGGLLGCIAGWAVTIGSVEHYPIIVGGKPLLSFTPFGVVAYICTILFGVLFTVAGMLINARLPRIQVGRGYDPRLTGNRFGLQIICSRDDVEKISTRLLESGAEEVKYVEV
jgi:molybdopterin-containing oxidoreductase family membrane subunit